MIRVRLVASHQVSPEDLASALVAATAAQVRDFFFEFDRALGRQRPDGEVDQFNSEEEFRRRERIDAIAVQMADPLGANCQRALRKLVEAIDYHAEVRRRAVRGG